MLSVKDVRLIAVVSVGVFLGNTLFHSGILSIPSYLWNYSRNWYNKYLFQTKYYRYLSDCTDLSLSTKERNVLILCHGRKYPIVHIDLLDYEKDNIITIDNDPEVCPHIVSDLSQPNCFKLIPNNSIDICIFHMCSCHTSEIDNNPILSDELQRIVRGELWVNGYFDLENNQTFPTWLHDNFIPTKSIKSNEEEHRPYDSNDPIGRRKYTTWHLQVWTPK